MRFFVFSFLVAAIAGLRIEFDRTGLKSGVVRVARSENGFTECVLFVAKNLEHFEEFVRFKVDDVPRNVSVDELIPDNFYQFRLDCFPLNDSFVSSNVYGYMLSYLKPNLDYQIDYKTFELRLNWTVGEAISEAVGLTRFAILYTQGSAYSSFNYVFDDTSSYDDDNEILVTAGQVNECFWHCFNTTRCLAFKWTWQNSTCHLITDLSRPKPCEQFYTCALLPAYKNELIIPFHSLNTEYCYQILVRSRLDFNGEYSERICFVRKQALSQDFDFSKLSFEVNFKPSIKVEGNLLDNQNANLLCDFDDMNGTFHVQNVTWYKDGRPLYADLLNKLNIILSDDGRKLQFQSLIHEIHMGHYFCLVQLENHVQIQSANNFELLIPFAPSLRVYSPPVIYQNESNYVTMTCVVEGYPVPNITWVFLEKNGTVNSVNGNIRENVYTTNITLYLTIFNIQSNQNGTYICYMLNNLLTQIQVNVVVAIRPEAPVILDAKAYQSRSYLSWYVPIDKPTNSELTELLLEWSLDFYDINTEPYSKHFSYTDFKNGNEQLHLKFSLPNGTYVRLTAFNSAGPSKPSEIRVVTFEKEHTTDAAKSNTAYFIAFIVTVAILALVLATGLVTAIVYKYKSKSQSPLSIDTKRLFSFKNEES